MNGGLALHHHLSPSNVSFVFQTPTYRSSTNFGIAFKLGGHGNGPILLSMISLGLEHAIMIVLARNKLPLGNGFRRSMKKKKIKIWHLPRGITLWTI